MVISVRVIDDPYLPTGVLGDRRLAKHPSKNYVKPGNPCDFGGRPYFLVIFTSVHANTAYCHHLRDWHRLSNTGWHLLI